MSLSGFYRDWFGIHGGREILLSYSEKAKDRLFITSSEELEDYVELCREAGAPAYVSVQPYQSKDQPLGIEKLFFEFDCPEDLRRAWLDAKQLADNIIRYYDAIPLLKFSGRKGYHVDVFLKQVVAFNPNAHPLEFVKAVYERLQEKILLGLSLPTLDRQVIGDVKRLERVPYSTHEATGQLCQPVDLEGKPLSPEECNLEEYRRNGLSPKLLENVVHELQGEEKWRALYRERSMAHINLNKDKRIRPCIQAALNQPLHGGAGHLMRLAIVREYQAAGYGVEQIIPLFQNQTDFDERKTRYYVEHAFQKRTPPFKCSTIKSLGFCLSEKCVRRCEGADVC
ncbi:MAG: hypothetical protein QXT30_03735 [Candidatus Bathyarchaeia archaeon]